MPTERHVKFFRNGRNQAVRIPREWEFAVAGGMMRREGTRLIIETGRKETLIDVLDRLEPLAPEHWMAPIESLPVGDVEL